MQAEQRPPTGTRLAPSSSSLSCSSSFPRSKSSHFSPFNKTDNHSLVHVTSLVPVLPFPLHNLTTHGQPSTIVPALSRCLLRLADAEKSSSDHSRQKTRALGPRHPALAIADCYSHSTTVSACRLSGRHEIIERKLLIRLLRRLLGLKRYRLAPRDFFFGAPNRPGHVPSGLLLAIIDLSRDFSAAWPTESYQIYFISFLRSRNLAQLSP